MNRKLSKVSTNFSFSLKWDAGAGISHITVWSLLEFVLFQLQYDAALLERGAELGRRPANRLN